MPYRFIYMEPEVYVEHDGVKIYRTYADDDIDAPREFWYTPDPEDSSQEVDVRGLDPLIFRHARTAETTRLMRESQNAWDAHTDDGRRAMLRAAINVGLFTRPRGGKN